jgi:hypothetical protein
LLNRFKKIKNKNLIKKIKTIKIKKIITDSLKLNFVKKNLSFKSKNFSWSNTRLTTGIKAERLINSIVTPNKETIKKKKNLLSKFF